MRKGKMQLKDGEYLKTKTSHTVSVWEVLVIKLWIVFYYTKIQQQMKKQKCINWLNLEMYKLKKLILIRCEYRRTTFEKYAGKGVTIWQYQQALKLS